MNTNSIKYVYHHKNPPGYQVRIKIDDTQYYSKLFSASKYGSIENSLYAAITWRNETLAEHGMLDRLSQIKKPPKSKSTNNSSGIIGVLRIDRPRPLKSGGITHELGWVAYGKKDKRYWKKYFSSNKYGDVEAFRLACKERFQQSGTLVVTRSLSSLPCVPDWPYIIRKRRK